MQQVKIRDSRFELLRIICILGITLHHEVLHSHIMELDMGLNRMIAQFCIMGGKLGVNVFVLISGYFCVQSNVFGKKILKNILTTLIYSWLLLGVFVIPTYKNFTLTRLLRSCFPITFGGYWFMTAFIGLMIFAPWLNLLVRQMSEKLYKNLLIVLFVMLSVIPTFTGEETWSSDIVWFVYLYLIAGYISMYGDNSMLIKRIGKGHSVIGFVMLMWGISIVLSLVSIYVTPAIKYINYFAMSMDSVIMLPTSISVFAFFRCLRPFTNKKINYITKHILGAYLIQSNCLVVTLLWPFMWSITPANSPFYLLFIVGMAFVIISIGIVVDIILSKIVNFVLNRKCTLKLCSLIDRHCCKP